MNVVSEHFGGLSFEFVGGGGVSFDADDADDSAFGVYVVAGGVVEFLS